MYESRARDLFERIRKDGFLAIEQLVESRTAENLFLDFKTSADNGGGTKLHPNDRNNFRAAIAGFANSEGGVIVWGVECKKDQKTGDDLPLKGKQPGIKDANRFVSWLNGEVSGATLPPHSGVENLPIIVDRRSQHFAVTLVEKGLLVPYRQVQQREGDRLYPIRAGSAFVEASHDALAGMFGRRPQPRIVRKLIVGPEGRKLPDSIDVAIRIMLRNTSAVVARELFFNVSLYGLAGPRCSFSADAADSSSWTSTVVMERFFSFLARDSYRVAPEYFASPTLLRFHICPPFEGHLSVESLWGCSGAIAEKSNWQCNPERLQAAFDRAQSIDSNPSKRGSRDWMEAICELLGMPQPSLQGTTL